MKTLKHIFALLVVTLVIVSCKNEAAPETKTVEIDQKEVKEEVKEKILNPNANYVAAKFEIDGMTCALGCAKTIEKNIAKMDGVKEVVVDFETKTAKVEYDEAMVNKELLLANVKKTGESYTVTSWNGEQVKETVPTIEE